MEQEKIIVGLDVGSTNVLALVGKQNSPGQLEVLGMGQAVSEGVTRGVITNCKDFWCDGAPVFKKKESGFARLGGERVDYTRLYEVPKMRYSRTAGGRGGGRYEAVSAEEEA